MRLRGGMVLGVEPAYSEGAKLRRSVGASRPIWPAPDPQPGLGGPRPASLLLQLPSRWYTKTW
jgi:hypothetical protein